MKPITLVGRRLTAAAVLALVAGSVMAETQVAVAEPVEFDAALTAYERNHWSEAYAAFARLADRGHPEATRIAWLMHRLGPGLYGQRFEATPYQQLLWAWRYRCGADCTGPAPDATASSGC